MVDENEKNLIVQGGLSATLLMALSLKSKEFVSSDFFEKEMRQCLTSAMYDFYKEGRTEVGNQGTVLMCLYSLLVLPKELLYNKYQAE